jgi:signal transduction histidine kinase/CheY-like chemotaxis protein/ligand-binding sensor domain-containing protein
MRLRSIFLFGLLIGAALFAQHSAVQAEPALANNRVLDLDGKGGNVELPAGVFDSFKEATIESWVKFGTQDETRFFSYGGMAGDICLGRTGNDKRRIQFFINTSSSGGRIDWLAVPDDIRIGRWYHVAAVCSTNGMRLHLNGVLVAKNDVPKSFNLTTNGPNNIGLMMPFDRLPSFTGEVDEFRVWKVARSTEQIRQSMNTRLTGMEPELAALWNFDDLQNPGKDATTNGYHGKLVKGAKTVEIAPVPGAPFSVTRQNKVLDLDGNDGTYVELPPNMINHLTNITVEGWVRWQSFGNWSRFFDFGDTKIGSRVTQVNRTRGLQLEVWNKFNAEKYTQIPNYELRPGEWNHIAVVSSVEGSKLYLNGVLAGTNRNSINESLTGTNRNATGLAAISTENRNLLGRNVWKFSEEPNVTDLNGQIDEFRIWSVARSQAEIVASMNERLSGKEQNLFGLWNFDQVEGGLVLDATTNAHHAQLRGTAKCLSGSLPDANIGPLTVLIDGRAATEAGAAVEGAEVWLEAGDRVVARGVTELKGDYRFLVSVKPGNYDLCLQRGEIGARRTITLSESGNRNEGFSCVPNINFSGTLSTFGQRDFLAAIIVQALRVGANGIGSVARTVNTDSIGNFSFNNLKPGDYQLRYQTATGFEFFENGKVFTADVSKPVLGLNLKMGPFKRGRWRTFSAGEAQTAQGFKGARTGKDSASVLVESSGLVWAGSSVGATRFDGRDTLLLTAYENGLVDSRVRSLFSEPDGTVWFGTENGLTRWDGTAHNFTATNGLISGAIRTIARGPDGTLWFGGDDGLARYAKGQFTRFTGTNGLPVDQVNQVVVSRENTVWLATPAGLLRFDGNRFLPIAGSDISAANSVMISADGSVWCGTSLGAVRLGFGKLEGARVSDDGIQITRLTTFDGLIDDRVTTIHETPDGTLWMGTEAGLSHYDGTHFVNYVSKDGLVQDAVATLSSSPDGILWVGCMNGGVCYYDPKTFTQYGPADGMLPGLGAGTVDRNGTVWTGNWYPTAPGKTAVYSIGISGVTNHAPMSDETWFHSMSTAPDGTVWAATGDGLMQFDGKAVTYITSTNGLKNNSSSSLDWDPTGNMYVHHYKGGITRYDGKVFKSMPLASGEWPQYSFKMKMYGINEFWLCGGSGLFLYDGNVLKAYTNGLPSRANVIFKEREGSYLVGTQNDGVARFDGKTFEVVQTAGKDRLSDSWVWNIFRDSKGVLWFMGGEGATRWDGKVWSTLSIPDGLSGRQIRWIGEGPNGIYWFATDNGLTRYQPSTNKPSSPRIEIAAAQDYKDREDLPPIDVDQRISFKYSVTDFRTRSETRRYRRQVTPGILTATSLPDSKWEEGTSSTQSEWVPDKAGDYTVAIQYVDRDLNYSDPTIRHLHITLPWIKNPWIKFPVCGVFMGFIGSSLFFGIRYTGKRREAERLRTQMLEQERKTRVALENKNGQLERARDLAETASRSKSVFLANMSHELRTPLTAIIGFTEILQDEAKADGKAEQEEDLGRIYDSARHLLGLINGILDLSKIEAQKMEIHLETFPIKDLVNDVASMLRPLVDKKENRLVIICSEDIGEMHADISKVRQCLLNLLGNANKFTEKGSIRLEVKKTANSNDVATTLNSQLLTISFVVMDEGIGMSQEQLEKLFEAFTQGESSTSRKYGGTGLGLTITKHFAEMMNGTVSVESELAQGSTFTLTLPVEVDAPSAPEPTDLPGDERTAELGECLLVIDDDPNVHRLIERTLQPEGFIIRSAMDGKAGLKMARELRPALITLDVMMPHTDGWSVLSALKSDPDLCNIPVVMLSIIGDKELGFALGASDYLIKPVNRGLLLSALKKYLPEPHGNHVLIVEDDPNLRELLRRMLEAENIDVVEAENGAIGIEKIKERIPGLILLDLMMPVMDGFAVLAELHRTPQWQRIPVVVVTAKELSEADRMQIIRRSDAIVQKGALSKKDLLREIKQLISKNEHKSGVSK